MASNKSMEIQSVYIKRSSNVNPEEIAGLRVNCLQPGGRGAGETFDRTWEYSGPELLGLTAQLVARSLNTTPSTD